MKNYWKSYRNFSELAEERGIPIPLRMYRKHDWVFWAGKASFGDYEEEKELEFSLGEAVIAARINHKFSQKALAEAVGTTQSVISHLETGRTTPTLGLLRRIGAVFGLKLWVEFY